ncbi:hypothetical protein ACYZTX_00590 [Pseudomonas sp. MDT1-17]
MAALKDLQWLMEKHGEEGVWLWDPFLNAEDVLRTLFFCPHNGVPLRALTAGKAPLDKMSKLEAGDEVSERELQRLALERAQRQKREQARDGDSMTVSSSSRERKVRPWHGLSARR